MLAEVASVFGSHKVSIKSMDQSGFGDEARLAFLTHEALSADVEATVEELVALESVESVGACIRVIDEAAHMIGWRGLLVEYADWLDLDDVGDIVTLQEGNTPLLHADQLSERLEADVWLKYEGLNPSGSFKDRGMTMAITKAKALGATKVICGSTGNTSAAAAAYAAKANMECVVLVPEGKIALGKLAQAIVYGAQVLQIRGNFDQALNLARELTQHLRSPSSIPSTPIASRVKRPARLRLWTCSARRPTSSPFPSVTRATSPPTGVALRNITLRSVVRPCPRCGDSKRPARRPSCSDIPSRIPKRSPRPSALVIRRVGCPR